MTVTEAAQALEVSPDLVYRLCRRGQLAHIRIGLGRGVIRISPADVAAFRAARHVEAHPPPADEPAAEVIRLPRAKAGTAKVPSVLAELRAKRRSRGS